MVITSELQLFQILKQKLGEKEAQALVEYVDYKLKENNEVASKSNASKEDIAKLEVRIAESKSEIIKWMFIFWIGSVGVISGIVIAVLNAYLK